MSSLLRQTLLMPLWLAQVFTQEKFFARNPIIGNRWLNEHGLHTARVAIACPDPGEWIPGRKSIRTTAASYSNPAPPL